MVFKPDIDESGTFPPAGGVPNGSGLGGGGNGGSVLGATPGSTANPPPTPGVPPATPTAGNGGGGVPTAGGPTTDAEREKAAKEAIAKLRTKLLDAETEMAVAKRTILRKNSEINKLEDLIRLGGNNPTLSTRGGNDPTLSMRLAAAEQERDDAKKEVVDLTVKLANAAGVLGGDLLVSYIQNFNDWADQLDRTTESLREVNM